MTMCFNFQSGKGYKLFLNEDVIVAMKAYFTDIKKVYFQVVKEF